MRAGSPESEWDSELDCAQMSGSQRDKGSKTKPCGVPGLAFRTAGSVGRESESQKRQDLRRRP
jgi:hypothetical protein